jgi:hypothetical protein
MNDPKTQETLGTKDRTRITMKPLLTESTQSRTSPGYNMLQSSSRTGWPLRNIHFSNVNESFPFNEGFFIITNTTFATLEELFSDCGRWNSRFWLILYLYSWEALEGNLHHKRDKQQWVNSLILDFSCACGMVVKIVSWHGFLEVALIKFGC